MVVGQAVIHSGNLVHVDRGSRLPIHGVCVTIRRIALAILLSVVLLTGVLGVMTRFSSDGAPSLFGMELRVVRSGSMTPSLAVGDAVVFRKATPSRLDSVRVGTTISFRVPGHESMVITHRVVEIGTDRSGNRLFTTKGDANNSVDGIQVDEAHVLGVYAFNIPWMGRLLVGLAKWRVLFTLVTAVLLASAATALARRAAALTHAHTHANAHPGAALAAPSGTSAITTESRDLVAGNRETAS